MLVDLGQCKSMSDISYLIKKRYKLSTPSSSLALFLDGYLLPPDESVHIIKDNDIIDVAVTTDGDDSDKEMRKKKKPKIKISGEKKVEPKRSTIDSDSDSDSSSSDKGGAPPSCKAYSSSVHTKHMSSSTAKPSTTSTSSVKLSSLKPSTNKPVSTSKPLPTVSTGKPSVKPSTSKPKPSVKPSTGKKPLVIKPPIIKPSTSILAGKKGGPSTNKLSTNKPSASGLSIDQRHKPCILTRPMTGSSTSVAKTASHVHFSSDDEESHSSQTGPMITTDDEIIENKDYSQFPPLMSLPKAGDTIAFKTLELSPEDYTPLVSDYKEGQVLEAQDNEQSIVIKLSDITLAREKKKSEKETEGKFAFPDSLPVEPESEIEISFSDLIQPILLQ